MSVTTWFWVGNVHYSHSSLEASKGFGNLATSEAGNFSIPRGALLKRERVENALSSGEAWEKPHQFFIKLCRNFAKRLNGPFLWQG